MTIAAIRIAQIVPVTRIGGILHHLLSSQMLPPNFESICVSIFDSNDTEALFELGPSTINLGLPLEEFDNSALICQTLHDALSNISPTVIHSHHNFSDYYSIPVASDMNVPAIRTVHGISQRDLNNPLVVAKTKLEWSAKEKEKQLALDHLVSHTLTVSAHMREKLIGYGFHREKISALYPGIFASKSEFLGSYRQRKSDDVFRIAFPHRLEAIKNPALMFEIVKKLIRGGLTILVYLPRVGTRVGEIEELIEHSGLGSSFRWLSRGINIWKEMQSVDVLLLTSLSEGLPITVLEAMIRSIPVVAPKIGGIPEVVSDGTTGLLISSESPDSYVEALRSLATNVDTCVQLGMAGHQRASLIFHMDNHLNQLSRLYQSLTLGCETHE